jgi:Asp-tRNA(Asn)/Glu-tRNA(Gln) amidotransferase A subunit family amidase
MLASFSPPYDATVVANLRNGGAVIVGKTNMDEFGMGGDNQNSHFGATRSLGADDWREAPPLKSLDYTDTAAEGDVGGVVSGGVGVGGGVVGGGVVGVVGGDGGGGGGGDVV